MNKKITPSQRAAIDEWNKRTPPGMNLSIGEVFADSEKHASHIRAMRRLVAQGKLKPGIPGSNPLNEAI